MGGNAFKGVTGKIHRTEVQPTIDALNDLLKLKYPMSILGSVGKKEFSGDIDIGIDIPKEDCRQFFDYLKTHFGDHDVRTFGSLYSIHFPIHNFDRLLLKDRPGEVQIDFIPGKLDWLNFFYHSPVESKLKGTHRNISMSTLAGFTDRTEDTYLDGYDRPIQLERYKWSPNLGFCRVERRSRRNAKTNAWIKKQDETVLFSTDNQPETVAKILFKGQLGVEYLDSCEKIIEAINIIYETEPEYKERIFRQMAWDLLNNHNIGNVGWEYPDEVLKHMDDL